MRCPVTYFAACRAASRSAPCATQLAARPRPATSLRSPCRSDNRGFARCRTLGETRRRPPQFQAAEVVVPRRFSFSIRLSSWAHMVTFKTASTSALRSAYRGAEASRQHGLLVLLPRFFDGNSFQLSPPSGNFGTWGCAIRPIARHNAARGNKQPCFNRCARPRLFGLVRRLMLGAVDRLACGLQDDWKCVVRLLT